MAALTLKVVEDLGEWADRASPGELVAAVAVLAALQARVAGRLLELARTERRRLGDAEGPSA